MKTIKLDAIDSTNDFLKGLLQHQSVENFTIVTAKKQTKGRGQMGAIWETEESKNLITSILIKKTLNNYEAIFELNIAVSLSIINALKKINIPALSIKWPNDIMSDNKKIAGILIENVFKEKGNIESIVGIGLNINQTDFEKLPKATSLKNIMNQDFEIEAILEEIVTHLQMYTEKIKNKEVDLLWKSYHELLFKIGKPVVFENNNQEKFMGIIQAVNKNGQLQVMLEDDSIHEYGIKEISMIY
ncbi:biotin--[acetyl-CoA-carboxylase] ligase [Flavobacterium amnicola]|uniref:Biotin--[acetyl-CoA-carboxylase] ligase n=1 Tax=Flavobacterium amnicola TaxID=2506422 RepID=A0A4Q1K1F7_9FLAO|nr:biotin--[acetyl-CoA-carboxylase] ligase [Flavobacterium amnicola]RXR16224.1 biotin--[acetyl-CoA-carboxylase] ligase [Flavobacterium amnicola]